MNTGPATPSWVAENGDAAARTLAWVSTALTITMLLLLPWWPSDIHDPSFLTFREEQVDMIDRFGYSADRTWWNVFPDSWFQYGWIVQIGLSVVAAVVVGRTDGWRGLVWLGVFGAVWQLVGVLGSGLLNTTGVPYLCVLTALMLVTAWWFSTRGGKTTRPDRVDMY
jgi:hypothetical protein